MKFRLRPKTIVIGKVYNLNQSNRPTDLKGIGGIHPYRGFRPATVSGTGKVVRRHEHYTDLWSCIILSDSTGRYRGSEIWVVGRSFLDEVQAK